MSKENTNNNNQQSKGIVSALIDFLKKLMTKKAG